MTAALIEWLSFFFLYCFFGWIYESTYVSVRTHQPVNRGFMHGPWIPLYGSGAVSILFLIHYVGHEPVTVYLASMVAATVLEFVTGITMEAIFKVRYWDYRKMPLNVRGYICLPASLLWGFFGMVLNAVSEGPVKTLIERVPFEVREVLIPLLCFLFTVDFVISVREALDFREMLEETEEKLRLAAEKAKTEMDAVEEGIRVRKEKLEVYAKQIKDKVPSMPSMPSVESIKEHLPEMPSMPPVPSMEGLREKLEQEMAALLEKRKRITVPGAKIYQELNLKKRFRMELMLSRNPLAVSDRYEKAMGYLKNQMEKRKKHGKKNGTED